jgi:flagellin-like protein
MNISTSKRRKAISPVLATVILIAITLIAAIAVAGFVFGLFGTFTSSAHIQAQVTSCTRAAPAVCTVNLMNTGTSNATPNSCTIQINGVATAGAVLPAATPVVAGAAATAYTCTMGAGVTGGQAGAQAVGSFSLSNGATVPYAGIWS